MFKGLLAYQGIVVLLVFAVMIFFLLGGAYVQAVLYGMLLYLFISYMVSSRRKTN